MIRIIAGFILLLLFAANVSAKVVTKTIDYKDGDTPLEGYLVYDTKFKGQRPGVMIVHDWMGLGDYAKRRALMIARLGYTAFAVDIYGKGIRPKNNEEASAQASFYKSDRGLMRRRAKAGLDVLFSQPNVAAESIAAIGYCFGGTVALEMARAGFKLDGVVSFHGGLNTPHPAETKDIKTKILVLHGADDPYVPPEEVAAFQKEMNQAKADWQMVYYSGAVHSFTHPAAGDDPSKGAAYQKQADERSWAAMQEFFKEIFQ